eukprot:1822425-Rhodomonas_salina.1
MATVQGQRLGPGPEGTGASRQPPTASQIGKTAAGLPPQAVHQHSTPSTPEKKFPAPLLPESARYPTACRIRPKALRQYKPCKKTKTNAHDFVEHVKRLARTSGRTHKLSDESHIVVTSGEISKSNSPASPVAYQFSVASSQSTWHA